MLKVTYCVVELVGGLIRADLDVVQDGETSKLLVLVSRTEDGSYTFEYPGYESQATPELRGVVEKAIIKRIEEG